VETQTLAEARSAGANLHGGPLHRSQCHCKCKEGSLTSEPRRSSCRAGAPLQFPRFDLRNICLEICTAEPHPHSSRSPLS
jgi:hypothetical protein